MATNREPSTMGIKDLKAELRGYGVCTKTFLDKESLVDAVKAARLTIALTGAALGEERLVAPSGADLLEGEDAQLFFNPLAQLPCGRGSCCANETTADQPKAMWRAGIFTGFVTLATGEMKKIDNPRDMLMNAESEDLTIEENLPGHLMTWAEVKTEFAHYPDSTYTAYLKEELKALPMREYLICYGENARTSQVEVHYKSSREEIESFASSLVSKCVNMSQLECLAAKAELTGVLANKYYRGETSLDNGGGKAIIAFLVARSNGFELDCPSRLAYKLEMLKKLSKDKGEKGRTSPHGKCDEAVEANEQEMKFGSFNISDKAESAATGMIQRLVNENNAIINKEDDEMYPFHRYDLMDANETYSDVPSPKLRAGDTVEVTVKEDFEHSNFVIKAGTAVNVYVVSVTSYGMVTGIFQTNRNKYWVYFPGRFAKKRVVRGDNWK